MAPRISRMMVVAVAAVAALMVVAGALLPLRAPTADATTLGYARRLIGFTAPDQIAAFAVAADTAGKASIGGAFSGTIDFNPDGLALVTGTASGTADAFRITFDTDGSPLFTTSWRTNTTGLDIVYGMAVDGGGFSYSASLLTDASTGDRPTVFIRKADASGTEVWFKLFRGPGGATPSGIAVDGGGRVFITGNFTGEIDFDPNGGTANLTSAGLADAFLVRLASDGSLDFAKQFGSAGVDTGTAIALGLDGGIHLAGTFSDTVDFDTSGFIFNLTSDGEENGFVLEMNNSGDLLQAKKLSSDANVQPRSIDVDPSGNTVVAGAFAGTLDADPGPGANSFTSDSLGDWFVLKLDDNGNLVWAKQFPGPGVDARNGVRFDAVGDVYLVGSFEDTVDFDPGAGVFELTSAGGGDGFVLKLDKDGAFVWVERIGGPGADAVAAVALDGERSVYLTGLFMDTVDFDPGPGTLNRSANHTSTTSGGAFITKRAQSAPPVNALPAAAQNVADDAALVLSAANGNRISLTDPDNGSSPLRVTLTVTKGTVSLGGTAGLTMVIGNGVTPAATLQFTGTLAAINAALNGLTFRPIVGDLGAGAIAITTQDQLGPGGGQTDSDTLPITVGRRPSAANDSYPVNTGATLTRDAATGVLANDSDADTQKSALQVQVVTGPTRGNLAIQPDGSFTYKPTGGSDGTDTFTYRVTDPQGLSATGTATIAITGVACGPRPSVAVTTSVADGALQAQITVTEANGPTNNRLQSIQFGAFQNAVVTMNGQSLSSGQTVTLPANTATQAVIVRRQSAGQPTTVPLTVTDSCGAWPTFVGGGAGAGF